MSSCPFAVRLQLLTKKRNHQLRLGDSLHPITGFSYAYLFNCTTADQALDSMTIGWLVPVAFLWLGPHGSTWGFIWLELCVSHYPFSLYHHSEIVSLLLHIAIVRKPPCELNNVCVLTTTKSRAKIWYK